MNTPDFISALYDPELFKNFTSAVTDELKTHLQTAQNEPHRVHRGPTPAVLTERAKALMTEGSTTITNDDIVKKGRALARELFANVTRLHSPHYMGHQVNPPVPLAGAMNIAGGVLNSGLAVYEMAQMPVAIEKALIANLGRFVGWPADQFDGIVTSGGTLANLTALLAARNWKFPNIWRQGLGSHKPAILAGADSHYSIARAAGMLGLGTEQVIKVPLDERRRMDTTQLPRLYAEAVAQGLEPFCLVGVSGSTPVGAFDDLNAQADFAEKNGLWFHLDAAHGGSLLLSAKHRELLRGADRADSICWDAHKMMFVNSLCTFLLYKERARSYLAFQQDAPYLFNADPKNSMASYDMGLRTVECTKGAIATPTWVLWCLFSEKVFAELIEKTIATTRLFYELVQASGDFVALHEPQANILCFRYQPVGAASLSPEAVSKLQSGIREHLVNDGRFYTTGTAFNGVYALRVTIMNPATEREHILALFDEIRELAKKVK